LEDSEKSTESEIESESEVKPENKKETQTQTQTKEAKSETESETKPETNPKTETKSVKPIKPKPVIIKDKKQGIAYTLEFSRNSVQVAESMGFNIRDWDKFPASNLTILFYTSFLMHHPEVTKVFTDELMERVGGIPSELSVHLITLYYQTLNTLISDKRVTEKNGQYCLEI
jgi:hypothetical protein